MSKKLNDKESPIVLNQNDLFYLEGNVRYSFWADFSVIYDNLWTLPSIILDFEKEIINQITCIESL